MTSEGRTTSQIITDAVNERYGYDLFDCVVGEDVITALAEAGHVIAPASGHSPTSDAKGDLVPVEETP